LALMRLRACKPRRSAVPRVCARRCREDGSQHREHAQRLTTQSNLLQRTNRPLERKIGKNEAALHRGRIIRCRAASRRVLGAGLWWSRPGRPFIHQAQCRRAHCGCSFPLVHSAMNLPSNCLPGPGAEPDDPHMAAPWKIWLVQPSPFPGSRDAMPQQPATGACCHQICVKSKCTVPSWSESRLPRQRAPTYAYMTERSSQNKLLLADIRMGN
jgi:hypothetical protein